METYNQVTTRQTLLAPGPDWDETLTRFHKCGLDDIYFDHRYFHLYANDANSVRAFVFDDKNGLFACHLFAARSAMTTPKRIHMILKRHMGTQDR